MWTVPDFRGKAKALQARGGRLIVIDPRRTETAAIADQHLFIRPGGDVFLLLGDRARAVRGAARAARPTRGACRRASRRSRRRSRDFTPEACAARCGIEAGGDPRARAHDRDGRARGGVRPDRHLHAGVRHARELARRRDQRADRPSRRAGRRDVSEGGRVRGEHARRAGHAARASRSGGGASRVSGAPEVFGELPMTCLAEEIETPGDGQIRALISIAGNPVLSAPNGPRIAAALESARADGQRRHLPQRDHAPRRRDPARAVAARGARTSTSRSRSSSWRNTARYSPPVLRAAGAARRSGRSCCGSIAIATGSGADAMCARSTTSSPPTMCERVAGPAAPTGARGARRRDGPRAAARSRAARRPVRRRFGIVPDGLTLAKVKAAPAGIDLGALAPRVPEMLRTPSGKIELAPPLLVDDLGRARADLARPVPELVIVGRRQLRSNNSWMHNLPDAGEGPVPLHRARASRPMRARLGLRRWRARADRERHARDRGRGRDQRRHDAGRRQPAARLGPRSAGHAARRRGRAAGREPQRDPRRCTLRDPLSGNAVLGGVPITMEPIAS